MKKQIGITIILIISICLILGLFILLKGCSKKIEQTTTTTSTTATTVDTPSLGNTQKITITFDSNGGSKIDPITINAGDEIELPEPTKKKNIFSHWEAEDGEMFVGTSIFNKNTKLKAKWEKKIDKIYRKTIPLYILDDNNILIHKLLIELENGESRIFSISKYVPKVSDGYKFSGWRIDERMIEELQRYTVEINGNNIKVKISNEKNYKSNDKIVIKALVYKVDNVTNNEITTTTSTSTTTITSTTTTTTTTTTQAVSSDRRIVIEDTQLIDADWDFNDLVFDYNFTNNNTVFIKLLAAGTDNPIRFNQDDNLEAHRLFGVDTNKFVNVDSTTSGVNKDPIEFYITNNNFDSNIQNLNIEVYKNGNWITIPYNTQSYKFLTDFEWTFEGQDIRAKYPDLNNYLIP